MLKTFKSLIISLLLLTLSCSSGEEKFREWINVNEGKVLTDDGLSYLIEQFGIPQDTLQKGNEKIFQYQGVCSFHSPNFSKKETEKYISEYNFRYDKLYNWLKESGRRQGLYPEYQTSSLNEDYESFKFKKNQLWDEFRDRYYDKVELGTKFSFNELVQDFSFKNPQLSESQSIDSIIDFYNIDDFDQVQLTSISYLFKIEENIWYSKYYTLDDDEKDYLIDLFQEVRVNQEGTIISDSDDGSYCLSEIGKQKLRDFVSDDWIYKMGSPEPISTFKFSKDGTYTFDSKMFSISKRGEWWVTCGGEIAMTNQDRNLQILDKGIRIGETIYRRN